MFIKPPASRSHSTASQATVSGHDKRNRTGFFPSYSLYLCLALAVIGLLAFYTLAVNRLSPTSTVNDVAISNRGHDLILGESLLTEQELQEADDAIMELVREKSRSRKKQQNLTSLNHNRSSFNHTDGINKSGYQKLRNELVQRQIMTLNQFPPETVQRLEAERLDQWMRDSRTTAFPEDLESPGPN